MKIKNRTYKVIGIVVVACIVLIGGLAYAGVLPVSLDFFNSQASGVAGDATISGSFGGSTITARTSSRFAGAIYSVTWKGKEFINSSDHGRELQSASVFDGYGECFNPTEAGSRNDGSGSTSTSVLQSINASGNTLTTKTLMAFWLAAGQRYESTCGSSSKTAAVNTTNVSNHVLTKKVTIGYQGIGNVIQHNIQFTVPESHTISQFEALTGYMPAAFSKFYSYNPATRVLAAISDGPGEISQPVILSTPDGAYAMGVYAPGSPGFGRFRFPDTVKWNCVYRNGRISAGTYSFTCYSIVGSLQDVQNGMTQLYQSLHGLRVNPTPSTNLTPTPSVSKQPITGTNQKPIGNFERIAKDHLLGWALDPDMSAKSIGIHVYVNGPAGAGTFIGATTANHHRDDIKKMGYKGNHGFDWKIPPAYTKKGIKFYIYAIDTAGGPATLLSGSPKSL